MACVPPPQTVQFQQWHSVTATKEDGESQAAEDYLIRNLLAHGIWSSFDRIWWFATSVQANAKIPLNAPSATAVTEVNSPIWAKNRGYRGNGTTSYENLGWAPSAGSNYTQNDGSMGFYANRDSTLKATVEIGSYQASPAYMVYLASQALNTSPSAIAGNINQSLGTYLQQNPSAQTVGTGFYSVQRTSSSANALYKNGSLVASNDLGSQTSTGRPPYNLCANAYNNNNSGGAGFSQKRISFVYAASSAVNGITFYNDVLTALTKVNAQ